MHRFSIFVAVFLCGAGHVAAEDSPLFHLCLQGSDNPEAVAKSKSACTAYLSELMKGVRFGGIVTRGQQEKPFCLPPGELTDEQFKVLFAKILADNPAIPPLMHDIIPAVVVTKAYRCPRFK
jgi:hypothetical protein